MKRLAAVLLILGLGGCANMPVASGGCPVGQARLKTAQLFFARNGEGGLRVTDADFRKFVTDEIQPRFPLGLSVLDGGAQWRGEANRIIRESAKVVSAPVAADSDPSRRLEAVRVAYRTRFRLDTMTHVSEPTCVGL